MVYDEFGQKPSKPIVDKIDSVVAQHYAFTNEELKISVYCDIEYRIGKNIT